MRPDFFLKDDLDLLHEYADKPYKKNNASLRNVGQRLSDGVWSKSKYWADQAVIPGFEVRGKRDWNNRGKENINGKKLTTSVFKSYTWFRILMPEYEGFKIYFTVGADGPRKSLVYKLDCQRVSGSGSELDQEMVKRFDDFVKDNFANNSWNEIPYKKVESKDWDSLISDTRRFLEQNSELYLKAIQYVWQGREPGKDKIARICWNTNDWQFPSGPEGKSGHNASHENEFGFGAEEWLFNFESMVDGFKYGFLEPINANRHAYEGKNFNIRLFSRNCDSKEWYYIGEIKDAYALTIKESRSILKEFKARKWLKEMEAELKMVEAQYNSDVPIAFGDYTFNIRFNPKNLKRAKGGKMLLKDPNFHPKSDRYILMDDILPLKLESLGKQKSLAPRVVMFDKQSKGKTKIVRRFTERVSESDALHNQIQDSLLKHLKIVYPNQQISKEAIIAPFNTRIDVARKCPKNGYTFYEIKTYSDIKTCIRAAIGQLFEYSCWTENELAKEWVIVSYHDLDPDAAKYLQHIQTKFSLPISYQRIDLV